MTAFGLLTGTQDRSYGGLPTLPMQNLIAEKAITEPRQFSLMSRPRLIETTSVILADEPTYVLRNGIAIYGDGGDSLSPYDNIYVNGVSKGRISASPGASMAGNEVGTILTGGYEVKFWDGATLRSVAIPDDLDIVKVLGTGDRFVFIPAADESSNGQCYYFTKDGANMLDGSGDIVVDGLAFISAQAHPDQLLDGVVWNGNLVLGGSTSIEIHAPSGDANAPWYPVTGSVIEKGIRTTGCMTAWNGMFVWMDNQYCIYGSTGGGYTRLSDAGIEELLPLFGRGVLLDSFQYGGHEFLRARPVEAAGSFSAVDLPHLLLSAQTMQWTKWSSNSGGAFKGGCVAVYDSVTPVYDTLVFGSIDNGQTLEFDNANAVSPTYAEDEPEYLFRFGVPIDGGVVPINNIVLRCQTYDAAAGSISLRTSRDKGNNWTDWDDIAFDGEIRQKIEWRARGIADAPGFLCEVKTSGLSQFSVSGATFDEAMAGRGRDG